MSFRLGKTTFFIGYEAVAAMTAVLILDRENRVICCAFAAVLHELGHLLMMRCFHIPLRSVRLSIFDVLIDADSPDSFLADFCITLGGPIANLLCAVLSATISREMLYAHLALGIFNLLPVMNLDGGHLLYLLLSRRFLPKTCTIILKVTTFTLLLPLFTAGLLILFRSGYNYSLLAVSLYLLAVFLFK